MQSLELECNGTGKLALKIVNESSHSFHLVPRRKSREERAEIIPQRWLKHMRKLIHNKVIILFLLEGSFSGECFYSLTGMSPGELSSDVCFYTCNIHTVSFQNHYSNHVLCCYRQPHRKQHHLWRQMWLAFAQQFVLSFRRSP